MIIDSHVHAGESIFQRSLTEDDLIAEMDRLGIEKAVLIPFKPPGYHLEQANDLIGNIVQNRPHRFIGLGRVDPWRGGNALSEIDRIFNTLHMEGLFIHPWEENCPLTAPVLRPVMEKMQSIKKPVMIAGGHGRVSHPGQIEHIAGEYPHITFIATSGGQINICGQLMWDAEEMFKKRPNVILETSGIYRRDFIEHMTKTIGAERILFGSGAPYFQQDFEMERIKTAEINNDEKEMIFGKNACRLFPGLNRL